MDKFKVTESSFQNYMPSALKNYTLQNHETKLRSINTSIKQISNRIDEVDRIQGISYICQDSKIINAIDHIDEVSRYLTGTIDDVEDLLDNNFYKMMNGNEGPLEALELATDKTPSVQNQLGITEIQQFSDPQSGEYITVNTVKSTITMADLLKYDDNDISFMNFADMFRNDYEALTSIKEYEHVQFEDYLNVMIDAGKFDHTVDKGWLNGLSTVLNTIGVVSLVSVFTGTDFITSEKYKSSQKTAAGINIGLTIVGFATFGIGTGASLLAKGAGFVVAELAAATAGLVLMESLDAMGLPRWFQVIGNIGMSMVVGSAVETKFKNIVAPKSLISGMDVKEAVRYEEYWSNIEIEEIPRGWESLADGMSAEDVKKYESFLADVDLDDINELDKNIKKAVQAKDFFEEGKNYLKDTIVKPDIPLPQEVKELLL